LGEEFLSCMMGPASSRLPFHCNIHILNVYVYKEYVMSVRVQVVLDEIEREAFRQAAANDGLSLSDWLRRAARERLEQHREPALSSAEDLRAFFQDCDEREQGLEPDWQQHRAVIEESKARGRSGS